MGLAIAALVAAGSGCGGGDDKTTKGGTLIVLSGADIDSIDPAGSTTASIINLHQAVHRGLYATRPATGLALQPDLASGPPRITDGGRTLVVRIRRGVRFAPPVGREVVADDLAYGLERMFFPSVNGAVGQQVLADVVGVKPVIAGKTRDVAGIEAPDRRTLVIRTEHPTAATLAAGLSAPVGVPVPREYARRFDAGKRSTYGAHQVATGPYRFEARADGTVTKRGFDPTRGAHLVRNPSWNQSTDARPAHLDAIDFRTGNDDSAITARRAIRGSHIAVAATVTPQGLVRARSAADLREHFLLPTQDSVQMMTLNTSQPPFSDPAQRRLVMAGVDRDALVRIQGGAFLGVPATHLIPPALRGFAQAGGRAGFPELLSAPHVRAAARTIRLVAGNRVRKLGEALQGELSELGFHVKLRVVETTQIVGVCGGPDPPDACLVALTYGLSDPGPILPILFRSASAEGAPTINFARLRSAAVDSAIEAASAAAPSDRPGAWAKADRAIMRTGAAVPLLWPRNPVAHSADVHAEGTFELDYTWSSLG